MKVFVGVTDTAWYQFLAARPNLTEVNFWLPGGGGFHALSIGEPFIFKSRSPDNRIVGGGFFNSAHKLPISDAWRIFGQANGVASLDELRVSISKYRREELGPLDDPEIGCVMLNQTTFLDPELAPPQPADWSPNVVRGKTYEGLRAESIAESVLQTMLVRQFGSAVPGAVFGDPRLVRTRIGQRPFQAMVLDAYHRRCAVTGDKIRPVLQAAHIQPISVGGENRLDNGLLLRSDVHTLFDRGYLTVDGRRKLRVSPRLRLEFGNGDEFYRLEKSEIGVPDRRVDRPNRELLEWHALTKIG